MPRSLISDWKRVATSGPTVDGRTIDAQDLRDIAEHYDTANYTAVIWYEHLRFVGSFGNVEAVKTADLSDGRVQLLARLKPNGRLLELNSSEQKLFTSIEIQPDFGGTGKAGLAGLAITDQPANLGTEALHFSRRAGAGNHFGSLEPLGALDIDDDQELSLITRFFNRLRRDAGGDLPAPETTPMDEKTAQTFSTAVEKLGEVATRLQTAATTFSAAPQTPKQPEEQTPPIADAITAEQFNALKGSLETLTEQFNAALNQPTGKPPVKTTGAVEDESEPVY